MIAVIAVVVVIVMIMAGVFASGILNQKKTGNSGTTIGMQGGTVSVNDTGPLKGVRIVVPPASNDAPVTFTVTTQDLPSLNLPQGAKALGKMIHVETSGSSNFNQAKVFEMPLQVTLPYDNSARTPGSVVRFYHYDPATHDLEATGYFGENVDAHTITFETATFSSFVAIEVILSFFEGLGSSATIDTGFRPAVDGWFIANYGSAMNPGGNCLGMCGYAKWYYAIEKAIDGTPLFQKYREGDPAEWRDDATAIQLASRAQVMEGDIWSNMGPEAYGNITGLKLKQTGYSQIHAMMVSNEPQMIDLRVQYNNGSWADYGHVVMAYSYTNGQFNIYDPNVPGSAPGTGLQVMPFNTTTNLGFKQVFKSGLTAGDALVFNIFRHINYRVFTPPNLFADLYSSAQTGFKDDTKFPKVVLTDPFTTPSGTTPADTDSDMMRNTDDSKAIISGTITGGGITVSSTLVYVAGVKYETNVVEGAFSIQVPLLPGDNEVIILATDANTYNKWAGWLKDFIKCKAAPAVFTVTLTWDQGSSDVDLHVLEPTVNGTVGEHVYYLHPNPGDESNHPYLDFDNTQGYGPEHYICAEGMSGRNGGPGEPLFGTYLIKVHYYADHSEAEVTQGITWHVEVRYLAFRDPGTLDEIWLTDEYSGYLGVANSGSAHSFSNVGPEWSSLMVFEYEAPNPADYGVPPPPLTVF